MLFFLTSDKWALWERRIGYFTARCQSCHQEAFQILFHMWRTKGTQISPPTPWSPMHGQAYQVRCNGCGVPAMVGHPQTWVPHQAPGFVQEHHHQPVPAAPLYTTLAIPAMR